MKFVIAALRAGVLVLIAANIYSIHKFNWSVSGWPSLFIAPAFVALLALVVLLLLSRVQPTGSAEDEEPSSESDSGEDAVSIPPPLIAFGMGFAFLVIAGFTPFWVNTWWTSERNEIHVTLDASTEATIELDDAVLGSDFTNTVYVGLDHEFHYKGHAFEIFDATSTRRTSVLIVVEEGWLGWEFIAKVH